ncbi:MAG TPA: helix-turn-helix transcriptional regulator [Asticcacaulis sp.]|nr:helix-turn-helix transcriptional regulator [Asticcacaulis sp.]
MISEDRHPHPIDLHVGSRVRLRRKLLGLSQDKLGGHLGLTFQQVQKYERGANRISASKLFEIANLLKVPVDYFYEGYVESEVLDNQEASESERNVHGFLMTTEGVELAQSFPLIRSPRRRRKILDLVRSLTEE